jgi:two-component system, LytTR family, response regulator
MINCLIVDDNKMARMALKQMVGAFDFLSLAGDCENIMEATVFLTTQKIDLILLDIELPKITGIDFLKTMPNHPLVILITARAEYAVEAFEYNVVDFLVKPLRENRFQKAILRAKEIFESNTKLFEIENDFFFIREKGSSIKLLINEILYVQALGDYVNIHTEKKRYTIHYTLSAIEKQLPSTKFMRVHRSYIVALNKIEALEEGTALIYQNPIPVSDNQRAELLRRLNLL